jgi:hypothetical protein
VNRLSANHMYLAKWVLPTLTFIFVTAWMFESESKRLKPDFAVLAAVTIGVGVIFVFVFKKRMRSFADEVLDGGDYLLVRFGRRQERVSLTNVSDIHLESQFGATTVRLQLSVPCEFGAVISFLAKSVSRNPFAPNPVAEDLVARIRAAK